jgi:hypothetical protein
VDLCFCVPLLCLTMVLHGSCIWVLEYIIALLKFRQFASFALK